MPKNKVFDVSRLPFDLPASVYHTIVIAPEIAGVMAIGTADEVTALDAIVTHWEGNRTTHPEFGVRILRKYGFSAPETKQQKDNSAVLRKSAIESMDLFKKIATETERPLDEVQEDVARSRRDGVTAEYLMPFVEDFLKIANPETDGIEPTVKIHTTLIQRAIPAWTDALTQALHPDIIESLNDLLQLEYDGLPAAKK